MRQSKTSPAVGRLHPLYGHFFFFSAGDASSQFDIDNSGSLTRTGVALDATATDVYFLEVKAVDSGGTPNTGTTTVIVYLDNSDRCSGSGTIKMAGVLIAITSLIVRFIF